MSEEPRQPQDNNLSNNSIDERIAQENIKKYLHENAEKIKPRQNGLRGFMAANRGTVVAVMAIFVIVLGTFVGFAVRQNSDQGTKLAQKEEMPEIERKVDYSTIDSDGDNTITEADEDAELYKIIDDTGYSSYSDSDDEQDPFVKDELEETPPSNDGYVDDDLGDTTIPEGGDQPYPSTSRDDDDQSPDSASDPGLPDEGTPTDEVKLSDNLTGDDVITSDITLASWNVHSPNSASNVSSGTKSIAEKAEIIGFQEMHHPSNRKAMRDALLCSSCKYSGYVKDYTSSGSSPSSVAIIWSRDRFSLNQSGYYKVSSRIASVPISAKWIGWVKLRDRKTGKLFYVLNTHTVASVDSSGKPNSQTIRVNNYIQHMDILTAKLRTFKQENIPIFITGDFNVNYRYDSRVQHKDFPYKRLGDIGIRSNWRIFEPLASNGISKDAETHGSGTRLIDYVWSLDRPDVKPTSTSIGPKYGSDHRVVYMDVNLLSKGQASLLSESPEVESETPEQADSGGNTANNPGSTLDVRFGSWNVYIYNNSGNVVSGVKKLMGEVDILGLQEAGPFDNTLDSKVACSSCDYDIYPVGKTTARKVPIVWNKKKFEALDRGTIPGGIQDGKQKWIVWIKFQEKDSGKVFYYLNTHFPHKSFLVRNGKEYILGNVDGKAWQKTMSVLVGKVKQIRNDNLPIFISGDINFDYRRDNCSQVYTPCRALSKELSIKSGWEYLDLKGVPNGTGTADSTRLIDYIFSWKKPYITYSSMRILYGSGAGGWSGSDHKPLRLSLTIGRQPDGL